MSKCVDENFLYQWCKLWKNSEESSIMEKDVCFKKYEKPLFEGGG